VETSTRRTLSLAGMLVATVAAIGLVAPTAAQQPSPTLLPPKPLPPPTFANGMEGGAGTALRPTGAATDNGPILSPSEPPPADSVLPPIQPTNPPPPRVWNVAPTGPQLPANGGMPPRSTAPMWQMRPMSQPTGQPIPATSGLAGWRMPNQGQMPAPNAPAAMLAVPRGAITPTARPDWNWHGYDTYNAFGRPAQPVAAANSAPADMAPYMKYAHLWRLSQNAIVKPSPAPVPTGVPAELPGLNPANAVNMPNPDPNVEWRGTGDSSNQGTAVSEGWSNNGVTTANFNGNLPTRPAQDVIVVEPPSQAVARTPLQVRAKISEVCSGTARNLIVEQLSPIRLRVAFMVRDQVDAETLTNQLSALRELAPYKVDFEVQIGQ
jgi:hypothetical protein